MKEYIAQAGGRYTYVDDLLNLQELAGSMTAIFDGCSNFIISGCDVEGSRITPGYVWINGKVRDFEGCQNSTYPFYLYEKNSLDSVTYANDVNKHGRCNYMVFGAAIVPQQSDPVTGALPGFIEMTREYSPRFIDRFFGKYALLLETPFSKQTIKRDLVLTGKLTGEKEIESKTAVSVNNVESGFVLKNIVRSTGDASIGLYRDNQLLSEFLITTDGSFVFVKEANEIARVSASGVTISVLQGNQANYGVMRVQDNDIFNVVNSTDEGCVNVNRYGYNGGNSRFRNFFVYDGKSANPLFSTLGTDNAVNVDALLTVKNNGKGMRFVNKSYLKTEARLMNMLDWMDRNNEKMAGMGYDSDASFDFLMYNSVGNILIKPNGYLNVQGELHVNGTNIVSTYVAKTDLTTSLADKVDKISGKQLSTEDFTSACKSKLDSIVTGSVGGSGSGFVTEKDITGALGLKLNKAENLSDLSNKGTARANLDVYSKGESNGLYFKISNLLSEVIALSSAEIEGKTPEQIIQLKESKQQSVRDNISAEKRGTGDLKLDKTSNLADLPDKAKARQNLGVYSSSYVDELMGGKLSSEEAYTGEVFTSEHRTKLEGIKIGRFAGVDDTGVSQSQAEGYVMISIVKVELDKKANKLLDGLSAADKTTAAANINVYTKTDGDARYSKVSGSFQDFVSYLVGAGESVAAAQKILRDKIDVPGKADLSIYLKKENLLSDLPITGDTHRKQICTLFGAAYAPDYQTKLVDTGWLTCSGSNVGTLFARQIGSVVCVQGTINTGKRTSNTWGEVAIIPNVISPPRYGCRQTIADFNDDHKYNRGCSFRIQAGSHIIQMHERGMYNNITELHFSYMT